MRPVGDLRAGRTRGDAQGLEGRAANLGQLLARRLSGGEALVVEVTDQTGDPVATLVGLRRRQATCRQARGQHDRATEARGSKSSHASYSAGARIADTRLLLRQRP